MMMSVEYELIIDTDENDARLNLLHPTVQKYSTIYNSVSRATALTGTLRRSSIPSTSR